MNGSVLLRFLVLNVLLFSAHQILFAQKASADSSFKPGGKLWGLVFGDYYYKAHADPSGRGTINQYTGIEKGRNAFQFRRIYLGYNYDIAKNFSAELLLAGEDNIATSTGAITGDLLGDNKLSFFIKLANLRWKNIWKGTDLVIGQMPTPAFPLVIEPIWGFRSVERTVADVRRTPSYDFGAALQGKFDPGRENFGYNIMVGNGAQARPENDKFKWFYGEVFAKFLDKRLVFDLYADYQRMNWTSAFHHSRNMFKGFVAYNTPGFTVGVEAFVNYLKNDVVGIKATGSDTMSAEARAVSVFAHATLKKDKLRCFARVDQYNPDLKYNNDVYTSYHAFTQAYEPNNKELFMTAGLDFTPVHNVHFQPNVWYVRYTAQQGKVADNYRNYDLVYRLTFFYVYGR